MVAKLQEKVTTKCFFAAEIGDKVVGKIVMGLTYFIIFLCFCFCFLQMDASQKTILITSGARFIGTHTMVQLLNEGFKVSIIDNLDNFIIEAVDKVKKLVGPELFKKLQVNLDDLRNRDDLDKLFSKTKHCQLNIYCLMPSYILLLLRLLGRVSITFVSFGLLGSPMVQWKNYFGDPN